MKTLRAKHTIHMTVKPGVAGDRATGLKAIPPEVKKIAPKGLFKAQDADQENTLLASGAAEIFAEDDAPATSTKPATPAAKPATPAAKSKADKAAAAAAAESAAAAAAAESAAKEAEADEEGSGDDEGGEGGDEDDERKDLI